MYLKKIKARNFRNYKDLNFSFKKPITVLVGDNAQGKTNFLESIYFLATGRSPKADKEEELVLAGEDVLRVDGELKDNTSLAITIQKIETFVKKKITINGVSKRLNDYSNSLVVVLFRPEDINLVIGSPSLRRGYIDQTISQVDREYKRTISAHENILIRKNKLLKRIRDGFAKKEELVYWVDQQILLGALITKKREYFFEYINDIEKKFGDFYYKYKPNEVTKERLSEYAQREIEAANSLIGPHRDDFTFLLKEKDLSKYGSRGEQRTSVLDLKLAEVAFIEKTINQRPVLLLDDIFSELDDDHRGHVIELSKMQQTIISTVEFDEYLKSSFEGIGDIVYVEKGVIIP